MANPILETRTFDIGNGLTTARMTAPSGGDDIARRFWSKRQWYEAKNGELLDQVAALGPFRGFLDVGAHLGNHAVYMVKSGLAEYVTCIEPDPDTFRLLVYNLSQNLAPGTWTALNIAAGDEVKTGEMYVPMNGQGNTGMHQFNALPGTSGSIACLPLNTLADQGIDFMKIDVERYELSVLRGASTFLGAFHVPLAIEVLDPDFAAVDHLLRGHYGYDIHCKTKNATPTYIYR